MSSGKQRDSVFQHPGEAALRDKIDRSRQLRSDTLGRGATVFVGYIRSCAKTQAKAQAQDQEGEDTWHPNLPPPTAAWPG